MSQVLIHIGFPKSGSTYLQKWFEEHPDLYFQPKHFAQGFYNALELARYAKDTEEIKGNYVLSCEDLTLFNNVRDPLGLRKVFPFDYLKFQNNICTILHQLHPTAKILIVTRGYTTIFSSIYAHYVAMAGTLTFRELMHEAREMFSVLLDYNEVIDLYRKRFGVQNVIVLPYELLKDDPSRFLSFIEKEMAVTQKFEFPAETINASPDKKTLTAYHFVSFSILKLIKIFPHSWQLTIYNNYTQRVYSGKVNSFMNWLSKFFSTEISMKENTDILSIMKGKAEIVRNEELFQPYLKQYLID